MPHCSHNTELVGPNVIGAEVMGDHRDLDTQARTTMVN